MPLPPKGGYIVRLVRRKHSCPEIVHSQLFRNGSGGAGTVPGEHDGVFHAQAPQGRKYVLRLLPQGVGDADHGGEHPVDGQIELGVLRGQGVELGLFALRDSHLFILENKMGAADAHLLPIH